MAKNYLTTLNILKYAYIRNLYKTHLKRVCIMGTLYLKCHTISRTQKINYPRTNEKIFFFTSQERIQWTRWCYLGERLSSSISRTFENQESFSEEDFSHGRRPDRGVREVGGPRSSNRLQRKLLQAQFAPLAHISVQNWS